MLSKKITNTQKIKYTPMYKIKKYYSIKPRTGNFREIDFSLYSENMELGFREKSSNRQSRILSGLINPIQDISL